MFEVWLVNWLWEGIYQHFSDKSQNSINNITNTVKYIEELLEYTSFSQALTQYIIGNEVTHNDRIEEFIFLRYYVYEYLKERIR